MPEPGGDEGWITVDETRMAAERGDGEGIRVAVIDSGIEFGHPVFAGLEFADRVVISNRGGRALIEEDRHGDLYGHGTAIAGIVHRLAPRATIGSFRVLRPNGIPTEPGSVRVAVLEALARGYQVINCSFGSLGTAGDVLVFKDWIDRCYLAGAHAIAACSNVDPSEREWPSHFASLISVGIGPCEEGEILYRPGQLVEFAAAGDSLRVPWMGGGEKTVLGSSFAAPQVAAIVARILSHHPGISPPLMKAALRKVARPF